MTRQGTCNPSLGIILVDASNLLFGAKGCYGQDAKIDYRELQLQAGAVDKSMDFSSLIFFPTFDKEMQEGAKFVGFQRALEKLGWIVAQLEGAGRGVVTEAIKQHVEEYWDKYQTFIFVTGSGDLKELYEQLLTSGKRVVVTAFPGCIAADVSYNKDILTKLLGEEVLWHYPRQSKSS